MSKTVFSSVLSQSAFALGFLLPKHFHTTFSFWYLKNHCKHQPGLWLLWKCPEEVREMLGHPRANAPVKVLGHSFLTQTPILNVCFINRYQAWYYLLGNFWQLKNLLWQHSESIADLIPLLPPSSHHPLTKIKAESERFERTQGKCNVITMGHKGLHSEGNNVETRIWGTIPKEKMTEY